MDLRHDIDLHYDLTAYEKSPLASSEILGAELALLSKLSGNEVTVRSTHNRGSKPFNPIEDSRSSFSSKSMLPSELHLRFHPIFWATTDVKLKDEGLDNVAVAICEKVKHWISE